LSPLGGLLLFHHLVSIYFLDHKDNQFLSFLQGQTAGHSQRLSDKNSRQSDVLAAV
jgi:hypothetical protein